MQVITEPTRIGRSAVSLLDLIFVSNVDVVREAGVLPPPGESDHELTFCVLEVGVVTQQPVYIIKRSLANFDYELFRLDLYSIPFFDMFDLPEVNDKVSFLTGHILNLINLHAPLKKIRIGRSSPPWLTDTIKAMQGLRDGALKKFKSVRTDQSWQYYKTLRNSVKAAIVNERKAYLEYQLQTGKNTWVALRRTNITRKSRANIPNHLSDANKINNYFSDSSLHVNIDNNICLYYLTNTCTDSKFACELISDLDVERSIFSIKSTAGGHDDLNIITLKWCCPHIIPQIRDIVNTCILTGKYPNEWKKAKVLPIPKKNRVMGFADLRPISILPVLSKVCERLLWSQLTKYVENNNLLPETQSGFRTGYGCVAALTNIVDDIVRGIDNGKLTLLCLLDYSKAFDRMNHRILAAVLHYIGVQPSAVDLITSYLSDREQFVSVNGQISETTKIGMGCPQGSVLSALLYTIYTANFNNGVEYCSVHWYADDTQLYISFDENDVHDACARMNLDLEKLLYISEQHGLSVNSSKTELILFGPERVKARVRERINIVVAGEPIPLANKVKDLGLIIDERLRFDHHVSRCIQKAYCSLKFIYGHRKYMNLQTKKILCDGLVLSHFTYADSLYSPFLTAAMKQRIQRVQNSCLRLLYGLKRRDHVSCKLVDAGWFNMKSRRVLHATLFYSKILTRYKPAYLANKICYRSDVHTLNLRFKGTLTPPKHKTELYKKSFTFQVYKIGNYIIRRLGGCASGVGLVRAFRGVAVGGGIDIDL